MQVVEKKLFSGSYDGSLKVWDASQIKDDTTFGKDDDKKDDAKEKQKAKDNHVDKNQNGIGNDKIMID